MKTPQLGPWPSGMNNRLPAHAVDKDQYGKVTALRNVVNAVLTNNGHPKRRTGFSKVQAGINLRAGFACPLGAYVVQGTTLFRWTGSALTPIYAGIVGDQISYLYFNGALYLTDGSSVVKNGSRLSDIPAGNIIRQYNGRIYVANGKTLWFTEPYSETVNYEHGFLQFTDDIDIMEPVESGIWVATGKETVFLQGGDPHAFAQIPSLNYGGIYGTSVRADGDTATVYWSTPNGVVAAAGGEIKNLQYEHVAPDTGDSGAALLRKRDGMSHYVATINNASLSPFAASDFMEMEVIRRAG